LAFPAPRHTYSLTQIDLNMRDSKEVSCEKSGAGGTTLGENGKSRAHHAANGGFSDTREMFGEYTAIRKNSRLLFPVDAKEPAAVGFFSVSRSNFVDGNF